MKVCEVKQTLHELKVESPGYWHAAIDILDVLLLLGVSLLLESDFGMSL